MQFNTEICKEDNMKMSIKTIMPKHMINSWQIRETNKRKSEGDKECLKCKK